MYVIIAGAGLFGRNIAEKLTASRHDVVVIDKKADVCEDIYERLGVVAVHGDATNIDTLIDAGIKKADVVVGAMRSDADNLSLTVIGKNFGVPRIYARLRYPAYESVYEIAGVTDTVNVVELTATPLVFEIEEPEIKIAHSFRGGKGLITIIKIPEGSPVHGKTIADIASEELFPSDCLITGIYRKEEDEFFIPRGGRKVYSGDEVFLTASADSIRKAARYIGLSGRLKPEE